MHNSIIFEFLLWAFITFIIKEQFKKMFSGSLRWTTGRSQPCAYQAESAKRQGEARAVQCSPCEVSQPSGRCLAWGKQILTLLLFSWEHFRIGPEEKLFHQWNPTGRAQTPVAPEEKMLTYVYISWAFLMGSHPLVRWITQCQKKDFWNIKITFQPQKDCLQKRAESV